MKISEITDLGNVPVDTRNITKLLPSSEHEGYLEGFKIMTYTESSPIFVFLVDDDDKPACAAMFNQHSTGIFIANRVVTYPGFEGKRLAAKIYKWLVDNGLEIRSDYSQTSSGKTLWTKSLPAIGLNPMLLDTSTNEIVPPEHMDKVRVYYPVGDTNGSRYIWVLK